MPNPSIVLQIARSDQVGRLLDLNEVSLWTWASRNVNSLCILLKCRFWPSRLWGTIARDSVSNSLLGEAIDAVPWTRL